MALTQAGTGPKSPPALTRVVQREKGVSHASVLTSIFSLSPYHPPHCTQFNSLLGPALRSETLPDNNSRSDGKVLPPGVFTFYTMEITTCISQGCFDAKLNATKHVKAKLNKEKVLLLLLFVFITWMWHKEEFGQFYLRRVITEALMNE